MEYKLCWYYSLVDYNELEELEILCNDIHLGSSKDVFKKYEIALEEGLLNGLKRIKI